jgi:hypothetical protein
MRVVREAGQLESEIVRARSEGQRYFGSLARRTVEAERATLARLGLLRKD